MRDARLSLRRPLLRAARWHLPWKVAVVALLAYATSFLVWTSINGSLSETERATIADIAFVVPGLVATLFVWRASVAAGMSPASRRAWRWIAVSALAYWIGDLLFFWFEVVLQTAPSPSIADGAYLAYYPLLLIGLLSFPRSIRSARERLAFALDAATVVLGGSMVVWYFNLAPAAAIGSGDVISAFLSVAYPLGDVVLLLGLAVAMLRNPGEIDGRAFRVLLAGLIVWLAADVVYGMQGLDGTYSSGSWVDGFYIAGWALLGLSGQLTYERAHTRRAASGGQQVPGRGVPLLPYLAVALGYGMLLASIRTRWDATIEGLMFGAIGLTVLVIIRQAIVVNENMKLLREQEERRNESRFRTLVQNASDAILVIGADGAVQYETPSVARVLGFGPQELNGSQLRRIVHGGDASRFATLERAVLASPSTTATAEVRLQRRDRRTIYAEVSATNLLDNEDIRGIVVTIRDIDDRKTLESRLRHQAFHDALTGLCNRNLFDEQVAAALSQANIGGSVAAVIFLDVDNFKTVNDSLGHQAGDQVLVDLAKRIQRSIRADDLPARLGGDEFAVLMPSVASPAASAAVAERILAAVREPHRIRGMEIVLSASLGIALSEPSVADSVELLRNADLAMYAAKVRGKGRFVFFEPGMNAPALERLGLEADLRRAIERDELELHYQPIVDLATGRIAGAEALLRWHRAGNGWMLPADFIPIAEETGLIEPIGRWVVAEATRTAAGWAATGVDPALFVAVNLSSRQLGDGTFQEAVETGLRESGLPADRLELEVTESILVDDGEDTIRRLEGLKALGVSLAIDDFGTGYSSLSYLRRLPVDKVKIDRSFVTDMDLATGAALVGGIVTLGHSLGMRIVAEGVELPEQAEALRGLGCELGQGFHFARPMPGAEFMAMLAAEALRAAA